MKAVDIISAPIPALKKNTVCRDALRIMNEFHVLHLPVVQDDQLIGLISEEELIGIPDEAVTIENLNAPLTRMFVFEHEHLFEVLKVMVEFKLSLVPVISKDEKFLGTITRSQLLNHFALETDILEPGGIIVLELNIKDYQLSEVARIVEENHARILGAFAGSNPDSNKMELTVKLNTTELKPIVESLNRHNYTIKETFTEPEYFDELRERYDALMNYLNI